MSRESFWRTSGFSSLWKTTAQPARAMLSGGTPNGSARVNEGCCSFLPRVTTWSFSAASGGIPFSARAISASALGAKSYWPVAPLIPFATIFAWSVGIYPPVQLRHLHGLPHRVRHFRLGDIAVRARGAGAVLDDPGAFEVVHVPGLEAVLVRSIADRQVVE